MNFLNGKYLQNIFHVDGCSAGTTANYLLHSPHLLTQSETTVYCGEPQWLEDLLYYTSCWKNNFKIFHQMCFSGSKCLRNVFVAGALPHNPLKELAALLQTPSWIWEGRGLGGKGWGERAGEEGRGREFSRFAVFANLRALRLIIVVFSNGFYTVMIYDMITKSLASYNRLADE